MPKTKDKKTRSLSGADSGIQTLLDAFPYCAQLIDSRHKIVAVNKILKRYLGMNENQLIGQHCSTVMHGMEAPMPDCPLEEALEKEESIERELFISKDARWISASVYPTRIATTDGMPTYLHFIRDITEAKNTALELSRNLEHHKALCNLVLDLQHYQNSVQIVDALINQVLSLSWLGMAATAVGFLVKEKNLEMVAHRNVAPGLLQKCRRLAPGECLCGKAAATSRSVVCSSSSKDHSIHYEGMIEHQHAVLPIKYKGVTLGVLTLYLHPGDIMDEFRLGFLEAATAAAGAALDAQFAREQVTQTQEKCLAQLISSQEDERKRVAGDLHDKLCQSLSAILLEFQSNRAWNSTAGSTSSEIESRIRDLIDQVQQMAGQLRPSILDDFGLESALARKIEELSKLKDIPIYYQCIPSIPKKSRLPIAVEVGFYRVAMEALLNVITHASAFHISVILMRQQKKTTLLIEDDGCGFDLFAIRKDMDRCKGLIEMEERMVVLGGKLRIESVKGRGTTIRAEVPAETNPQTT